MKCTPLLLLAALLQSGHALPEAPLKLTMIKDFTPVESADPPQDCHYADPYKQACKADELAAKSRL